MQPSVEERQHVVNGVPGEAPDWTAPGGAFTRMLMLTFPLERRLSAAGEALARAGGQTLARWLVLEEIDRRSASVAEIGRSMGLARQGVQRLADLLVGDGLAVYADNPRHARAKLLVITDDGRAALRSIQRAQRDWADRLGTQLGAERLNAAAEVMGAVLAAVEGDDALGGNDAPER